MKRIIYVLSENPFSGKTKESPALLEVLNELQEKDLVWKYSDISSDYYPLGSSFTSLDCLKKFYFEEDLNKIDSEIKTFKQLFEEKPTQDSKEFADNFKKLSLSCEFYLFRILTREVDTVIETLNQQKVTVGILINKF